MTMTMQPELEDPFYMDRPLTDRPIGGQKSQGLTREDSLPDIHKDDTRLFIPSVSHRRVSVRHGGHSVDQPNTIEKKKQNIMIGNEVRRPMGSFSHQREIEDDYSERIKGVLGEGREICTVSHKADNWS
jgi:hypothetical protein